MNSKKCIWLLLLTMRNIIGNFSLGLPSINFPYPINLLFRLSSTYHLFQTCSCSTLIIFYLKKKLAQSRFNNVTTYKLYDYLFTGYNTNVRPVFNVNTLINISLDLSLMQILSIVGLIKK